MPVSQAEDGHARRAGPRLRHPARRGHRDARHGVLALAPRTRDERAGRTCRSTSFFARWPRRAAATRSASSSRAPPRTAPKGCGPSRRRTASRSRRIPRRRSSAACRRARSRPASSTTACRSRSSPQELVRLSRHPYVAVGGGRRAAGAPDDATCSSGSSRSCATPSASTSASTSGHLRAAAGPPDGAAARGRRCSDYLALLEREPDEVRALYEDVLIHVTSFFRDPEVFEALKTQRLPGASSKQQAREGAPIRIWVAGCSTGEEVYSLGDLAARSSWGRRARARSRSSARTSASRPSRRRAPGVYPDSALRDVSEERRKRYFTKVERGYRINKAVRDLCVFVRHDLARDPPFSKLDLVSCRNVLIYFDPALQKRVLPTFHYCLNQPGFLLLGRTESISGFGQLFSPVDKANKIFARTAVPQHAPLRARAETAPPMERPAVGHGSAGLRPTRDGSRASTRSAAAWPATRRRASSSTRRWRSCSSAAQTGPFLSRAPGEPQNNLLKMARAGLVSALRAAIAQAKKEMAPSCGAGCEVDAGGLHEDVRPRGHPLHGPPDVEGAALRRAVRGGGPAEAAGAATSTGAAGRTGWTTGAGSRSSSTSWRRRRSISSR